MRLRRNPSLDYILIPMALALATVFIYAGADKLHDPLEFADSIAAFAILPAVFINPLALGLPIFEIACGLLLLLPRTRRVGAFALAFISALFFSALLSALARGLTLDCGCFGSGTPSRPRMWLELGLDLALIASSLFIYCRELASQASALAASKERVSA
jgi:putative oxidoreductase